MKKVKKFKLGYIIIGIAFIIAIFSTFKVSFSEKLDYPTFLKMVEDKQVSSVVVKNNTIEVLGENNQDLGYVTNPDSDTFKEEMLKSGVEVTIDKSHYIYLGLAILVLIVLFIGFISKKAQPMVQSATKGLELPLDVANTNIKFDNVAGVDIAKEKLVEIVEYLKNPNECVEMGIKPPTGVLLTGSPGTGKTLLAKAVAGEAGVPFYSVNGSDFVEMYVGVGAKRVRELFAKARKTSPCILFIDEIDTIGKKRGSNVGNSNDERDQTLNALLTELNGFSKNDGIVVIAATNRIDILDEALTRPGRFDRHVEVDLPDVKGREEILRIHAKNKPLGVDVDLKQIAKDTSGFSGADLENLLNESGWEAIRNKRKTITSKDIDTAFNIIIVGDKKKHNFMSKKERKLVAYHEGGHALVTRLLANIKVEKVTIQPTSKALGYVRRTNEDILLQSRTELFNDICVSLAGRISEELIFGKDNVTTGASQDFKQATRVAYAMIFNYGMSDKLGVISLDNENSEIWHRVSDDIKNIAYSEVQDLLDKAYKTTKDFLTTNKVVLDKLANQLLEFEEMNSKDFDSFLITNQDFLDKAYLIEE